MISLISGKIAINNGSEIVVITTGGVGYKIFVNVTKSDNWTVGGNVEILTHLIVREDVLNLFGFVNEQEKQLFLKVLSVSGIGPKSALHLLTLGDVEDINRAILSGDINYLTKVSGVGKKTAERIVVELKSKIVGLDTILGKDDGNLAEVIDGLVSLGYTVVDARAAVKDLSKELDSGKMIREALKKLSK